MGKWQKLQLNNIYQNQWIQLNVDKVLRPDGEKGEYSVITTSDTISIIVKEENCKIRLVYLHRYPNDSYYWEVIKGRQDGESPQDTARRELAEEMGLAAGKWTKIGYFEPSNGLVRETNTVYLAENLQILNYNKQGEEGIEDVKAFTLGEIEDMIRDNEIIDGFTIAAIHKYKLFMDPASSKMMQDKKGNNV